MDTGFAYTQLFESETFNNNIFQGLNINDMNSMIHSKREKSHDPNDNLYLDTFDPTKKTYNPYPYFPLDLNSNPPFYDALSKAPVNGLDPNLLDYEYFQHILSLDQKQPQWLPDTADPFLPQPNDLFCDDNMMIGMSPTQQLLNYSMLDNEKLESSFVDRTISRDYVSLSDVNSFVAKADSEKHGLSSVLLEGLETPYHEFRSPSVSTPEGSDYDSSDHDLLWPSFTSQEKLMIKIKNTSWTPPKRTSKVTKKYRKSMPNIHHTPKRMHRNLSLHSISSSEEHTEFTPIKKGRNVDKACNHCKRSHLRCDDMRPCRRCVSTGKNGCKDVQHKPRGRPKLQKQSC